jgi:hypothetical protein
VVRVHAERRHRPRPGYPSDLEVTCDDDGTVNPRDAHLSPVHFTAVAGQTDCVEVGAFGDTPYTNARLERSSSIVGP